MDSSMFNYTPWATIDDGSCIPVIYGCMDPTADNYIPQAEALDGDVIEDEDEEVGDVNTPCCTICDGTDDNNCCIFYGCMNEQGSINFDPNANVDDGSCIPYIFGCTDPTACNYYSAANTDDGSCLAGYGCTDSNACNFDPYIHK